MSILPLPSLGVARRSVLRFLMPLAVWLTGCTADRPVGPVVFGLAGPFGQPWGATVRLGAELARKQVNATGGINGRPLEFRLADDNSDVGRAAGLAEALLAAGDSLLEADPYLEDTEDFRPYLRRLQNRGAKLVFIAGLQGGAERIVRQARRQGLGTRFMGGDGIEALVGIGAAPDSTLIALLFHPSASAEAEQFTRAYREEYSREPDSFAAAAAYDAVWLLARAAREVGTDRERIRNYLADIGRPGGSPPYQGATGTLRFDARGDPTQKEFALRVVRNGRIQLREEAQ